LAKKGKCLPGFSVGFLARVLRDDAMFCRSSLGGCCLLPEFSGRVP
jgi:hypothetical protein